MMISRDAVMTALRQRRCLRSQRPLAPDEFIIARAAFPALFQGRRDQTEANFLKYLLSGLTEVISSLDEAAPERLDVRRFMELIIDLGQSAGVLQEEFVHRYVFEFWKDLWSVEEEQIVLSEKFYKCQIDERSNDTRFVKNVLPKLRNGEAIIDIVGVGGFKDRNLYVIELKQGCVDDRAVGQILRYYHLVRNICDRSYHDCDIRRVIPVWIVHNVDLHFWDALPIHFREILRIYKVDRTAGAEMKFRDLHKVLQSHARDRLLR